jgi:hypothetical protein
MPDAHRDTDLRICGAHTQVIGQTTVFVNGLLWSVEGDVCDHGHGELISTHAPNVYIEGKRAITITDPAHPDDLCDIDGGLHCDPIADTGSPDTDAADVTS